MGIGADGNYEPASQYDPQTRSKMREILGRIRELRKNEREYTKLGDSISPIQAATINSFRKEIGGLVDEAVRLEGHSWTIDLAVGRRDSFDVDEYDVDMFINSMAVEYAPYRPSNQGLGTEHLRQGLNPPYT